MLKRFLFALVAIAAISMSGVASAQVPYCGGGNSPWIGGGWNLYIGETIPYFSMFPPVYYKYPPVPRSFGYSPFAYPPGTMTPDVEVEEPMTITNPHVAPKSESKTGQSKGEKSVTKTTGNKTAGLEMPERVQVIVNPFAGQSKVVPASY